MILFLTISFSTKKTDSMPIIFFSIILIYITNKIYPGNPHFMLYEIVSLFFSTE